MAPTDKQREVERLPVNGLPDGSLGRPSSGGRRTARQAQRWYAGLAQSDEVGLLARAELGLLAS
jgi:hypothetical protein